MAGLSSTFGLGATTNSWTDLSEAGVVLIAGANVADNHPVALRRILAAKSAGAKLVVADPRRTRTADYADVFAQLRPGTDIALAGAFINIILEERLYDREYLEQRTNALYLVDSRYSFADGVFSGYSETSRTYDTSSWSYITDATGRPAKAGRLDEAGTVFGRLREHFARYDAATVSAITGVRAATIREAAATISARRPLAILYALGITQHTTAVQAIRSYAILALLLGSVGVAGGGVNALRGEANLQGSTDLGSLATHLPGYLPVPSAEDTTLEEYARRHGRAAARRLASLLGAWFGDAACRDRGDCYKWLPRRDSDAPATYIPMLEAMAAGRIRTAVAAGINPMVSTPDNRLVAKAFASLDLLAVIDLFPTETAEFWRLPGVNPRDVGTEVVLLPAAHLYEKEGSLTSGSRRVQWQPRLLRPPGGARPDLAIIDALFRAVRRRYAASTAPRDAPLLAAAWDYGRPPRARKVLREIDRACWLYDGVSGQLANRRGFSWPTGDEILYYNGRFPTAEGVARLFAAPYPATAPDGPAPERVSQACCDGPLPEFYEPAESPAENLLHPAVAHNPLLPPALTAGDRNRFPHVLTVYTAANGGGHQAVIELSPDLAAELAVRDGDAVAVASPRGELRAVVAISDRLRPLTIAGKRVHTVAMPLGRSTTALGVNALTVAAGDPATGTPGAKTCQVRINKE